MQDTMDEDLLLDPNDQFAFGEEENDTELIFPEYAAAAAAAAGNQSTTWQRIVEMKSAAHEGFMAHYILREREQEGLPLYAKSLFSIHSPIERFSRDTDLFSGTVANRTSYIEHREAVILRIQTLSDTIAKGSHFSRKFTEIPELLAMQLYGFGRAALQEGKITMSLDAFRIAGILRKPKIVALLQDYIMENPLSEEVIKEYIHYNA